MIEVEKKFHLTQEQEARLLNGAEFLGEQVLETTYYDTADYALSRKDQWLRKRNGAYDLKVSMSGVPGMNRSMQSYNEIETEEGIMNELNLEGDSLEDAMQQAGLEQIMKIVTTRRKYTKDGFNIDIDVIDFGYELAEIELLVEDEVGMPEAKRRILAFAEAHGLEDKDVNGKVLEYLKRFSPKHYQALIDAGLL